MTSDKWEQPKEEDTDKDRSCKNVTPSQKNESLFTHFVVLMYCAIDCNLIVIFFCLMQFKIFAKVKCSNYLKFLSLELIFFMLIHFRRVAGKYNIFADFALNSGLKILFN